MIGFASSAVAATVENAAPTNSVVRSPIADASAPPRTLPSGMIPQTIQRREAFIRPSIRGGTCVW